MLAHLDVGDDVLRAGHGLGVLARPGHDRARARRERLRVRPAGRPQMRPVAATTQELLVERPRVVRIASVERVVDDVGHSASAGRRTSIRSSSAQLVMTPAAPAALSAAARSARSPAGTKTTLPSTGNPAATADWTPGTASSIASPWVPAMSSISPACT